MFDAERMKRLIATDRFLQFELADLLKNMPEAVALEVMFNTHVKGDSVKMAHYLAA